MNQLPQTRLMWKKKQIVREIFCEGIRDSALSIVPGQHSPCSRSSRVAVFLENSLTDNKTRAVLIG